MGQIRVHVGAPDIAVPETGALTQPTPEIQHSDSVNANYYFGLGIIIAIMLAIVLPGFFYKIWKKQGLTRKHLLSRVVILAIFSFGLTFSALIFVRNSTIDTIGTTNGDTLTVLTEDVDIYVELSEEPVFASASSNITISDSTDGGYVLKTYGSSNLISTTDTNEKISGLTTSDLSVLSTNNWGFSLISAESQNNSVWQALPTTESTALTIKGTTMRTPVNDQVTVYFGVYITPDVKPGTYVGTINYAASANLVMQKVSEWGSSVAEGQEVIAIDKRDGKQYTVARHADGNLWMTQNLDLDINSSTTYTPADTDIAENWMPSISTYETGDTTWVKTNTTPESYDPGEKYWNTTTTQSGSSDINNYIDNSGDSHYHLGNYYNWTAAIAMNDSSAYTEPGTLSDQSICPSGWTLPRSAGVNGTTNLFMQYGYDPVNRSMQMNPWSTPLYFLLSGEWNGSFSAIGNYGLFWYPYASSISTRAGRLYTNLNNEVLLNYATTRSVGISVRCVARPTIESLTYMQDFTELTNRDKASVFASMAVDNQYQLKDKRDEKTYWISKLKDGNVWMTQNLDLNLNTETTYTSADTDLPEGTTWTPVRSTYETTDSTWGKYANSPESYDPGDKYWNGISVAEYNASLNAETGEYSLENPNPAKDSGDTHYHIGNYYNYTAAVAMNNSSSYTSTDNPSLQSICPSGWTLPNVGNTGDKTFYGLLNKYGFTSTSIDGEKKVWKAPLYLTMANNYGGGGNITIASQACFASPTASNKSVGRILLFYQGGSMSSAGSGLYRRNAASVRCILR